MRLTIHTKMLTIKLSSKGQIVIPKEIRDQFHWEPGTEFIIEKQAEGISLKPKTVFKTTRVRNGLGMLARTGREPLTQEGIDQAVLRIARQRDRATRK